VKFQDSVKQKFRVISDHEHSFFINSTVVSWNKDTGYQKLGVQFQ